MKFARTVCGDIQAEEMGFTYPHEHLYAVPPICQKDRDLEVSDYEGSVAELKLFKSVADTFSSSKKPFSTRRLVASSTGFFPYPK